MICLATAEYRILNFEDCDLTCDDDYSSDRLARVTRLFST